MDFLKRTSTRGVCLSAGGVTAFYPTKVPFHDRSPYLGKTDMFGDLTKACKKMGIRVLGRVDPHAMHADALAAHPEWVARNADGTPKKHPTAPDLYPDLSQWRDNLRLDAEDPEGNHHHLSGGRHLRQSLGGKRRHLLLRRLQKRVQGGQRF